MTQILSPFQFNTLNKCQQLQRIGKITVRLKQFGYQYLSHNLPRCNVWSNNHLACSHSLCGIYPIVIIHVCSLGLGVMRQVTVQPSHCILSWAWSLFSLALINDVWGVSSLQSYLRNPVSQRQIAESWPMGAWEVGSWERGVVSKHQCDFWLS